MRVCSICGFPFNAHIKDHWKSSGHRENMKKTKDLVYGETPKKPLTNWVELVNDKIDKWVFRTEIRDGDDERTNIKIKDTMSFSTIQMMFD